MSQVIPGKSIFILSVFRATSTLLFKIFSQIIEQNKRILQNEGRGSAMLLEPFSQPYYLENQLPCPGMVVQESLPKTFSGAMERVLSHKGQFVVAKDQGPQCLHLTLPENEKYVDELLSMFNFVFLLRNPEQTLASHYHPYFLEAGENTEMFSSEEAGFLSLEKLFNMIMAKTGKTPLVIEAEDYLQNPEGVLSPVFRQLGAEFRFDYLSWPCNTNTENADFNLWGDTWYSELRKSSGVIVRNATTSMGEKDADADESRTRTGCLAETPKTAASEQPEQEVAEAPSEPKSKYPNTIHNHVGLRKLYEEHFNAYKNMRQAGILGRPTA